jgi:TRAP-type C4-dicarboxylate transport system permease small subunit
MVNIRKIVDKILEYLLIFLMGASVINVLWQVFTRFIMQNPSSFTEEIARFLLIWIGLLGAAYGIGKKIHLAIDLLKQKVSDSWKIKLDIIINSLIFIFAMAVMVGGGIHLVNLTFQLQQISAALQIKLGFVYLAVPLSGCLMGFYSITNVIGLIKTGRTA